VVSANEEQSVKKVEYFEVGISPCFLSKERGFKLRRANDRTKTCLVIAAEQSKQHDEHGLEKVAGPFAKPGKF
jgi:hypothetical protein